MAYTLVLEASALGIESSSLSSRTKLSVCGGIGIHSSLKRCRRNGLWDRGPPHAPAFDVCRVIIW